MQLFLPYPSVRSYVRTFVSSPKFVETYRTLTTCDFILGTILLTPLSGGPSCGEVMRVHTSDSFDAHWDIASSLRTYCMRMNNKTTPPLTQRRWGWLQCAAYPLRLRSLCTSVATLQACGSHRTQKKRSRARKSYR